MAEDNTDVDFALQVLGLDFHVNRGENGTAISRNDIITVTNTHDNYRMPSAEA